MEINQPAIGSTPMTMEIPIWMSHSPNLHTPPWPSKVPPGASVRENLDAVAGYCGFLPLRLGNLADGAAERERFNGWKSLQPYTIGFLISMFFPVGSRYNIYKNDVYHTRLLSCVTRVYIYIISYIYFTRGFEFKFETFKFHQRAASW